MDEHIGVYAIVLVHPLAVGKTSEAPEVSPVGAVGVTAIELRENASRGCRLVLGDRLV
jgi:hypothetical protein